MVNYSHAFHSHTVVEPQCLMMMLLSYAILVLLLIHMYSPSMSLVNKPKNLASHSMVAVESWEFSIKDKGNELVYSSFKTLLVSLLMSMADHQSLTGIKQEEKK